MTPLVTGAGSVFVGSNRVYRAAIVNNPNAYSWTAISDTLTGNASASISVLTDAFDTKTSGLRMYAGTSNGKIAMTENALDAAPVWTDVTGSYRSVFPEPHLLRSIGGRDWEAIGTGLPTIPANTVVVDPLDSQRIFVGTDIGAYESTDGGATFAPFMTGLPLGMVVTDLEIAADPHVLVAGTYGRGTWKIALETEITDRIFADGFDPAL